MTRDAAGFGAQELTEKINKLLHEGNVRRIVVRTDKGRKVLDLPLTIGVVAVAVWPLIAAAGAAAALAGGWKLEVEHTEPEVVDQQSEED